MTATTPKLETRFPREMSLIRFAGLLQAASGLLWIGQAGLLARAVGGLAPGAPAVQASPMAADPTLLALLRAAMDGLAARGAFHVARAIVTALRRKAAKPCPACPPFDCGRPASGPSPAG
jgi:ATP-binding cassette subfamily C protein CydD